MPAIDLTADELAAVVAAVRRAISEGRLSSVRGRCASAALGEKPAKLLQPPAAKADKRARRP